MKYQLNTRWLAGIPNTDQERLKARAELVLASGPILDELAKIIEDEMKRLDQTDATDYESPSWAYKEADRKGQLRAYRNILALTKRTPVNDGRVQDREQPKPGSTRSFR